MSRDAHTVSAPEELLTAEQVASVLGVSPATLRNWRVQRVRRGPTWVYLGGRVRYRRNDLDDWIANLPQGGQR